MRRTPPLLALALTLLTALFAPSAQADFGLNELDVTFTNEDGSTLTQAGAHPFALTTTVTLNTLEHPSQGTIPAEELKDLTVAQIPGLVGDPTAVARCANADFMPPAGACSNDTALGISEVTLLNLKQTVPVYNLIPPPGVAAKIGFAVVGEPITINLGVNPAPPFNVVASLQNVPQILPLFDSKLTVWGNPADPAHDTERGSCVSSTTEDTCPSSGAKVPFLTVPRACQGPLETSFEATSWLGSTFSQTLLTHGEGGEPQGFTGCAGLAFAPSISASPTAKAASSPSGLDFSLDVANEGLTNPEGLSSSDIRKVEVTLPEGFTVNPSIAEGLEVCNEADLARETAFSAPGTGCPEASKIGTVEVETPLLDESVDGALYQAEPYDNPFGALIALYMVIKNPTLGIIVTQPLKVESNPTTGQLRTVADQLPQLPFSHFRLHFREGTRSPLATPSTCGTHTVNATLYPWAGGEPVTSRSAFQIISGPDNGPCPAGGLPPFRPGLLAGTINNRAGSFSPFNLGLSRSDSEQEITHFSIKLPPGVVGKLAGLTTCSDAAIAAAKARTGPNGGHEELASPSCPGSSYVGRTLVGSGVGPSLAYAPGNVYLAGPYHGAPISIVAITAGVVGPFDLGTVVVREALKINPETAEVFIDATGSDPIPHIIKGIPVHLRDIRVYTDRPEFVLNPTSCARTSTASTVLGSGLDFASEADDNPVTVSTPFQAADCASLGFKPRLALRLRGGTKRGDHPALRAVLRPRPGDANSRSVSVQLPHSAFLEQGHIKTICTRVQFKEGAGNGAACPAGSVYGHARAFSPLFSDPLEGPVFLRSSEHELPDLVLALHGLIDFDAVGRIDSVDGGIRNTFDFVPDAPVSEVVVNFQGGKKGLIVNSTDLCRAKHRAIVKFTGHNGKAHNAKPLLRAKCGKKGKKGGKRHSQRRVHR